MNVPTAQPTHNEDRQTGRSLLLGVVIWFLHLNTFYPLTSLSCKWGWLSFNILGMSGLQFVETIISLIALALMGFLVYLPFRSWRRFQTEKPTDNPHLIEDTQKDRRSLVAFIVLTLNSFFFLYILASFVPIFALRACGQG